MILFFKILFKEIYHLWRTPYSRVFLWLAFRYGDIRRHTPTEVHFLGYRMHVPDCQSFLWQFKEIFGDENYRFSTSSSQPVIYDCGANVGVDIFYFKRLYPQCQIKAFEADPTVSTYLQQNIQQNNLTHVEVISKAVWYEDTTVSFAAEGADGGSVVRGTKSMQIPATRLRNWLENETVVDLLKMDIEGAETLVIQDCREALHVVKHIFIEYHAYVGQAQSLDIILQILAENGFRYFIRSEADRKQPFVYQTNKKIPHMDLQLNIFGYRSE